MTFLQRLSSRTILAPMAGVTDKPFRKMVRKFGNHLLFTEMVSATALCYSSKRSQKILNLADETGPVGIQIVGHDPKEMLFAAQRAEDSGAFLIDINMGCPVKKIITNGAGAALMNNIPLAQNIVQTIKSHIHVPLTVKMRLGFDIEHINVSDFAKAMELSGVDAITIHARTKEEGYSGVAHWDYIRKVKETVNIPVFANGDILDYTSKQVCLAKSKADAAMVGRASLGKPWILSKIDGENPKYILSDLILEHLEEMLSYYGTSGLLIARKHLAWYASSHSSIANFRRKIYTETNLDNIKLLIQEFFGN